MHRRTFAVVSNSRNCLRKSAIASFHSSYAAQTQQDAPQTPTKPVVTVFGSGFVGRNIAKKVAPHAETVVVASRCGYDFRKWLASEIDAGSPLANVNFEQVDAVQSSSVDYLVQSSQVVVNTIGIQYEAENTFVESFIYASRNIAHSASKSSVPRLIKLSTLGADMDHPSRIFDMDYRGEDITYGANSQATILRSAFMFGRGNNLLSSLAKVLGRMPFFSLPKSEGRFQPVWVEDVAQAVVACMNDPNTAGKLYELGGPQVYNLKELVQAVTRNVRQSEKKVQIALPNVVIDALLMVAQFLPEPSFTRDHLPIIHSNMVVTSAVLEGKKAPFTFADLGITPASMDSVFQQGSKKQ